MSRRKGFTMVELMIVIVIVAILASVAIPMLRGRIERAKFTEGMAACSSIATSIMAYVAENPDEDIAIDSLGLEVELGFASADLEGKYFAQEDYEITAGSYDADTGAITYTIVGDPSKDNAPDGTITLTRTADGVSTFSYSTP